MITLKVAITSGCQISICQKHSTPQQYYRSTLISTYMGNHGAKPLATADTYPPPPSQQPLSCRRSPALRCGHTVPASPSTVAQSPTPAPSETGTADHQVLPTLPLHLLHECPHSLSALTHLQSVWTLAVHHTILQRHVIYTHMSAHTYTQVQTKKKEAH